jgi:hypothetical protein
MRTRSSQYTARKAVMASPSTSLSSCSWPQYSSRDSLPPATPDGGANRHPQSVLLVRCILQQLAPHPSLSHDRGPTHPPESRLGQSTPNWRKARVRACAVQRVLRRRDLAIAAVGSAALRLLAMAQFASVSTVLFQYTACPANESVQLLPIPRLPDVFPIRNPRPPTLHLKLSHLHRPPRLRWSRSRSSPPTSADSKEPQREILQGFPIICHRQLAGWRRHEDELLLPELGCNTVAVPIMRHVPSLLRPLSRIPILHIWSKSGAIQGSTDGNRHGGKAWRVLEYMLKHFLHIEYALDLEDKGSCHVTASLGSQSTSEDMSLSTSLLHESSPFNCPSASQSREAPHS